MPIVFLIHIVTFVKKDSLLQPKHLFTYISPIKTLVDRIDVSISQALIFIMRALAIISILAAVSAKISGYYYILEKFHLCRISGHIKPFIVLTI